MFILFCTFAPCILFFYTHINFDNSRGKRKRSILIFFNKYPHFALKKKKKISYDLFLLQLYISVQIIDNFSLSLLFVLYPEISDCWELPWIFKRDFRRFWVNIWQFKFLGVLFWECPLVCLIISRRWRVILGESTVNVLAVRLS